MNCIKIKCSFVVFRPQFIILDFKITFLTKNADHNGISQEGSHLFSVCVEQIKTAIKMGGEHHAQDNKWDFCRQKGAAQGKSNFDYILCLQHYSHASGSQLDELTK